MRIIKTAIPLLIFFILVVFLWRGLSINPHLIASPLIGKPVPAFSQADLFSANHKLNNTIFKGHISLFNVFASWCMTCHVEHPVLMDIAKTQVVTLIGLDYKDKRKQVMPWLKQVGNPYQHIVFDSQGTLAINLGVYGTPETFIIDQHGIIRYKHIGQITTAVWQKKILPIIQTLKK